MRHAHELQQYHSHCCDSAEPFKYIPCYESFVNLNIAFSHSLVAWGNSRKYNQHSFVNGSKEKQASFLYLCVAGFLVGGYNGNDIDYIVE